MSDLITETELSLMDQDFAEKIKDILSAKYGLIELSEPILHTAVANAAALSVIITELRRYHSKQRDNLLEEHQAFREGISDTLLYFEKNLVKTLQKAVSETCTDHIEQFRVISQKQTTQIKHLIDTELPIALKPGLHSNNPPQPSPLSLLLVATGAAVTGMVITLLAVLCVI